MWIVAPVVDGRARWDLTAEAVRQARQLERARVALEALLRLDRPTHRDVERARRAVFGRD